MNSWMLAMHLQTTFDPYVSIIRQILKLRYRKSWYWIWLNSSYRQMQMNHPFAQRVHPPWGTTQKFTFESRRNLRLMSKFWPSHLWYLRLCTFSEGLSGLVTTTWLPFPNNPTETKSITQAAGIWKVGIFRSFFAKILKIVGMRIRIWIQQQQQCGDQVTAPLSRRTTKLPYWRGTTKSNALIFLDEKHVPIERD